MKGQHTRRPRPPQRKKKGWPEAKLYLDSFSALTDFLRHKPAAIKGVYCKDSIAAKVDELLVEHPGIARHPLTDLGMDDFELASPLYAELQLEPMAEAELWPRLAGRPRDLLLALDHITDPRNLGAIARSAAFFGVKEMLVPRDRQVLLTKASVATSQGAFALTSLVTVVNLGRTLDKLKEEGYWILGTAMEGESLEAVAGEYEKVVLVLGAEDKGLSQGIKNKCDRFITIGGASERLDSLNVAVAAGILLRGLFSGKIGTR